MVVPGLNAPRERAYDSFAEFQSDFNGGRVPVGTVCRISGRLSYELFTSVLEGVQTRQSGIDDQRLYFKQVKVLLPLNKRMANIVERMQEREDKIYQHLNAGFTTDQVIELSENWKIALTNDKIADLFFGILKQKLFGVPQAEIPFSTMASLRKITNLDLSSYRLWITSDIQREGGGTGASLVADALNEVIQEYFPALKELTWTHSSDVNNKKMISLLVSS